MMRLNKYLSDAGICSRREADRLIEAGKVTVDGNTVGLGTQVEGTERIICNGRQVTGASDKVVLAYNKPVGVICSTVDQDDRSVNIVEAVHYSERVYPVGRLDKDSSGLILLTNDGTLMDRVLRSRNGHEKEYEVQVDHEITEDTLQMLSHGGIPIEDGRSTKPCTIKRTGEDSFNVTLTEGMNRQIRKICMFCGYNVIKLKRIRFMNIKIDGIDEGKYRLLTDEEIKGLGGL